MSQVKANAYYDSSGGSAAQLYGVSMRNGGTAWVNRIINGDMRFIQRGAGPFTVNGAGYVFGVDRTAAYNNTASINYTVQQSGIAPPGFTNSLVATVTTAGTPAAGIENKLFQYIEGFNVADLGLGTANAQTFTLSFWVRSSVAGTYVIGLFNNDGTRAFSTTYTINSANTFEYKTITVQGDTSGTWNTGNLIGLGVNWYLGTGSNFNISTGAWTTKAGGYGSANSIYGAGNASGVNWVANAGATFYITGVQLEAGSVATPFERRSYGTEDSLCKRYFQNVIGQYMGPAIAGVSNGGGGQFLVEMRAAPTMTWISNIQALNFPNTAPGYYISTTTRNFWPFKTANGSGQDSRFHDNYTASAEL